MEFKTLNLDDRLLSSLDELGYKNPTKVQEFSIPEILNKKDLIVMAKTGSGKTGAFSLPILENVKDEASKPQALIITPTRELAVQVNKDIRGFLTHLKMKTTTVYGGHNMAKEISDLKAGAKIITGTPGRVIHHIKERNLDTRNIKYLVLDEADRMLDMGFIDQMYQIIKALPKERVTLLFSATMPDEIQKICKNYMTDPLTIAIDSDTKTVDTIKQSFIRVEANEKRKQLERILYAHKPKSCMIFCNMRVEVDKVQNHLFREGFVAEAIHGANTQNRRMKTIENFKNGNIQILVATDVAARGIHIDDMEMVINYDIPQDKDSYIHRIGRTGRAGSGGKAINIVTSDDIYAMYEIEEHAGAMIEEDELPDDESVLIGKKELDALWSSKREVLKKSHTVRKETHTKRSRKPNDPKRSGRSHDSSRSKHNHNKPKHEQNRPKHKHKTRSTHDRINRREHPKMHQEPVRRVIEENFVPIRQKPVAPVQKKKKFSLRNLFKK